MKAITSSILVFFLATGCGVSAPSNKKPSKSAESISSESRDIAKGGLHTAWAEQQTWFWTDKRDPIQYWAVDEQMAEVGKNICDGVVNNPNSNQEQIQYCSHYDVVHQYYQWQALANYQDLTLVVTQEDSNAWSNDGFACAWALVKLHASLALAGTACVTSAIQGGLDPMTDVACVSATTSVVDQTANVVNKCGSHSSNSSQTQENYSGAITVE